MSSAEGSQGRPQAELSGRAPGPGRRSSRRRRPSQSLRRTPREAPPLPEGTRLEFDPSLPIAEHHQEIADLIRDHQVVVVAGETGSGKTTQLPKICLALGRARVVHTQPRRIAARTVAERIAEEVGVPLGDLVGYQVRFTRQAGRQTRVKVVTDGILLAEVSRDPDLLAYDTVIIDEAHERSLNIDFLLGHLKQVLPRRPDLRVVITSATIDTARFSEHFDDAPVIEVSGRTYPVEVRHRPLDEDTDQVGGITAAVQELWTEGPGDILVFLSGEREIRDAADAVAALELPDTEVLPLYARLSSAEQHRVFQAHRGRRVVLATNVAETSITVPGIRYVVDPGTARISRWSARTKVQRLPIEPISQASANQRAGRCGRVAPGIAIRLYSEEDYLSRPEFTEPEILRTNLASVILQMAEADLGDIASFPFVERPDGSQITDGLRLLDELGALRPGHRHRPRLTEVGHQLARLPVDPRLARMLVEAHRLDCLREVLVIVSALAIPDVRERPADKREQADALHARFHGSEPPSRPDGGGRRTQEQVTLATAPRVTGESAEAPLRHTVHTGTRPVGRSRGRGPSAHGGSQAPANREPVAEGGDVLALVRLWEYLRAARRELSGNAFRRLCRDEFLNVLRVREWEDLHAQLREICRELDWRRNDAPAPTPAVLTAVLSGLLSHVGLAEVQPTEQPRGQVGRNGPGRRRRPVQEYLGARGARFAINPGSSLAKNPPPLVMAVELVETSRLWARTVAEVRAEWIEQVGAHLLKRQHSEPHWSSSSGSVMAYERVTLYGVPIVAERPVNYARINPEEARQIFLRQALVEGNWRTRHEVFAHNAAVRAEAEALEERSRRRGVVVDDQAIVDFYDRRVPHEVVSASHFDAWWRRVEDKTLLEMTLDDLVHDTDAVDLAAFPDQWRVGEVVLPVRYVFEPGSGHDGVTVTIPIAQLNQLSAEPFSWQVPGLRQELATELIRGLPKAVRTQFVPAPNHAREALAWLDAEGGGDRTTRFADELGRALQALTGHRVEPSDWGPDQVPSHLQVNFEVSERGVAEPKGRDFDTLRRELAARVSTTLTRATQKDRVTGATSWTFPDLEPSITVTRGGTTAVGYPCLVDERTSVGVVVVDSVETQVHTHRLGLRRLLTLTLPDQTKWVISHLSNTEKVALAHSPYGSVADLLADARLKTAEALAVESVGEPTQVRTRDAFEALSVQVRQAQADRMRQVVSTAAQVLQTRVEVTGLLERAPASTRQDVTQQLDNLVFTKFISATPDPWFGHLPRYLAAMAARLEAAIAQPARDLAGQQQVDEVEDHYADVCAALPPGPLPARVEEIGYLIEELRVSLFAQRLRTSQPVSVKRLHQAMEAVSGARS